MMASAQACGVCNLLASAPTLQHPVSSSSHFMPHYCCKLNTASHAAYAETWPGLVSCNDLVSHPCYGSVVPWRSSMSAELRTCAVPILCQTRSGTRSEQELQTHKIRASQAVGTMELRSNWSRLTSVALILHCSLQLLNSMWGVCIL